MTPADELHELVLRQHREWPALVDARDRMATAWACRDEDRWKYSNHYRRVRDQHLAWCRRITELSIVVAREVTSAEHTQPSLW